MGETSKLKEYASRKLWLCILSMALSSLMLYGNMIDMDTWKAIVLAALWGYLAGNVGSEVVSVLGKPGGKPRIEEGPPAQ